ncbi:hypothetical protein AB1286_19880 [Trinickia sp. NRRL B-1857]|uniref:hypothetical protein n=1 Tax=Trinickia sp. NRRL B-1857 TaxID=3162879 RepID=UPI003D2901C9
MSDLKELLAKGAVRPADEVAAPFLYIDEAIDKTGVRFEIPPIPAGFFPAGAKTMQCCMMLRVPNGSFSGLDVAEGDGPLFDVEKDKATQVTTAGKAFENALYGAGNQGMHEGVVDIYYGFFDTAEGGVLYSTPTHVEVHFPASGSAGG